MVVRRHGADNTHRDFTVRRHKVLEAVLWLKTNNPYFKCIEIDREAIQILPENGIPEELRYVVDENNVSVHVENEGPPEEPAMSANGSLEELVLGNGSTSFIPMRQRQRKEGAAIQDAVNETDPLDWPSTEGNIVNEFKTDGLATMAFPTLFPYGKGDPTSRARQHGITLTESFKHLMKFAERLANGKFEWRFASHPRFPYWALNMKQRHQLLSQANIYLCQHPADANMTMEELKEMVNSMSANQMVNRLQRYASKVQGTNQYWYQRLQELLSLIDEQKGCPTFFFTFSAADSHWPDLQRLLQNNEDATRTERAQAVIDNPHLTDWFFKQRLEEFIKHWLILLPDAPDETNPAMINLGTSLDKFLGKYNVRLSYYKGNLSSLSEAFDPDQAVLSLRVGYYPYQYLLIGVDYFRTFAKKSDESQGVVYDFVDQVSPFISFQLPL